MEMLEQEASSSQLDHLDQLWADYLAQVSELRDGLVWINLGGRDPYLDYLHSARDAFEEMQQHLDERSLSEEVEEQPVVRGATWTYVIKDQPFGAMTERIFAGMRSRVQTLLRTRRPI